MSRFRPAAVAALLAGVAGPAMAQTQGSLFNQTQCVYPCNMTQNGVQIETTDGQVQLPQVPKPDTPQTVSGTVSYVFPVDGSSASYDLTPSGVTTLALSGGRAGFQQTLTFYIRQPASGSTYAVTLPSGVLYPGGSAPTVSTANGSITRIMFETDDAGVTILGGI